MERNYTIDFVRLIASFCIMTLHTSLPSFGFEIGSIIKLSGRWAVPFFFITTGYFLGLKIKESKKFTFEQIENNIINLISILIISSLIYLIYSTFSTNWWFNNRIVFLFTGTFWHLWFIGSMIFGYLVIWYLYFIRAEIFLLNISILLLLIALFSDSYDITLNRHFNYDEIPRFLISIPFMYIGIYLSNRTFSKKSLSIWIIIFFIGFILQFFEAFLFYKIYGYSINKHQILIGTIMCSIALFIICLLHKLNENRLARYGNKYSLFIYLYHLIGYWFVAYILGSIDVFNDYLRLYIPLIGFIFMLGISIILDKLMPKLFLILNGNINLFFGKKL